MFLISQKPRLCVGLGTEDYVLNYLEIFIILIFFSIPILYSVLTNEQLSDLFFCL